MALGKTFFPCCEVVAGKDLSRGPQVFPELPHVFWYGPTPVGGGAI